MIMGAKTTRKNPNWKKNLLKRLDEIKKREAAVGFPTGKGLNVPHYTRKRADGSAVAGPSILDVAVWNNFGVPGRIPARPFMDRALPAIASAWERRKANIIRTANRGDIDADKELGVAGQEARNIIVLEIDATTSPANDPHTVKRKKSEHPLIDTGAMKGAVTYAVRLKGGKDGAEQ